MRISATALESFRLYMQPDQEWMTEADLVATLRGAFTPTPAILLGLAFGKCLETPDKYRVQNGYRVPIERGGVTHDFEFADATMAEPLSLINRAGVFEAKAISRYGAYEVVSKADHLFGLHLSEFKTTEKGLDFEKYEASYQWRYMVDAFGATKVTYHIFRLDDHENGVAELREINSFNLWPYTGLRDDCRALVEQFDSFIKAKGLVGELEASGQRAAALGKGAL